VRCRRRALGRATARSPAARSAYSGSSSTRPPPGPSHC
jgi:hypothetical protein